VRASFEQQSPAEIIATEKRTDSSGDGFKVTISVKSFKVTIYEVKERVARCMSGNREATV